MIVVVAGAGASRAVAPRYLTTEEFIAKIPRSVRGRDSGLFEHILYTIQDAKDPSGQRKSVVDVEEFLGWLARLRDDALALQRMTHLPKLSGHSIACASGEASSWFGQNTTFAHLSQGLAEIQALRTSLCHHLWTVYNKRPTVDELKDNWTALLRGLLQVDRQVEIYTLNYDRVLEVALEPLRKEGTTVLNGFSSEGEGTFLHPEVWDDPPENMAGKNPYVLLTKLHGSLNWDWEGDDGEPRRVMSVGWSSPPKDPDSRCIVYPELGKCAHEIAPFSSFYDRLRRVARECNLLITIGYAHRDIPTNEAIKTAKKIRFIDKNPDAAKQLGNCGDLAHVGGRDGFCGSVVGVLLDHYRLP